ncbi:MAG TPA: response regulator [Desulfobacteraceae bacterium]|nr:response regulator [Desulfobacteraceae bacterium]|tara:strand:- start:54 stop:422 length:369 start_codon:yes stop_codon:yes gene_type:complete
MSPKTRLFIVLDDEQSIRQSIASFLEDEGYTVLRADSAEAAISIVQAHPVDAAVVDIRLPGKDGNHFMIEARKIRPDIKFVVHTGSADYSPPEEIRDLGVTREKVLIKPVRDLSIILDALKS